MKKLPTAPPEKKLIRPTGNTKKAEPIFITKKTYRSKIELTLIVPVALVLVAIGVFMIVNQIWIGAALVALLGLFGVYLCLNTGYEFIDDDDKLKIKSGFLYQKEIYVNSIRKIRATKNHIASPALSTDRLEILYNRYGRILISPDQKSEFINRLRQLNPRITMV
jgi:hypothetical protein